MGPRLLTGLIDYAGLFPPARLDMDAAAREYESARSGPHGWMLDRFIVPASRLDEVAERGWPLAVVADGSAAEAVAAVATAHRVSALEGRADPEELRHVRDGIAVFAEVRPGDETALDAVAAAGIGAKVRCGGEGPAAVPAVAALAGFISGCAARGLRWKATAGLHHPFADAAEPRHGFVNLLAAAALAEGGGDIAAALAERDPAAFALAGGELHWRGQPVGDPRAKLTGYGSCSFAEPVAALRELGWL